MTAGRDRGIRWLDWAIHERLAASSELGGRLEAHSDGVGRGARFTLTLPLAPPERLRRRFQQACA